MLSITLSCARTCNQNSYLNGNSWLTAAQIIDTAVSLIFCALGIAGFFTQMSHITCINFLSGGILNILCMCCTIKRSALIEATALQENVMNTSGLITATPSAANQMFERREESRRLLKNMSRDFDLEKSYLLAIGYAKEDARKKIESETDTHKKNVAIEDFLLHLLAIHNLKLEQLRNNIDKSICAKEKLIERFKLQKFNDILQKKHSADWKQLQSENPHLLDSQNILKYLFGQQTIPEHLTEMHHTLESAINAIMALTAQLKLHILELTELIDRAKK